MDNKHIEDLKEIKEIMNRSTRFISLSGISGISTGIMALIGSILAYFIIFKHQNILDYNPVEISNKDLFYLLLIAFCTLLCSIVCAIYFTNRKTKKANRKIWDSSSKRLLTNLSIPLITGGVLCLMLLFKGFIGFLAPLTLIFYGLALVNGSKYTFKEIKTLGLIEIALGLVAFQFIAFGLFFWMLGFGITQISYGLIVQAKY